MGNKEGPSRVVPHMKLITIIPIIFMVNGALGAHIELASRLFDAIARNDCDGVQQAIDEGAKVNAVRANDRRTPLHEAAVFGCAKCIDALFEAGAVLDVPDISGSTPLHLAAANRHEQEIQALLGHGARRDLRDAEGRTAAEVAALFEYWDALTFLLEEDNSKTETPYPEEQDTASTSTPTPAPLSESHDQWNPMPYVATAVAFFIFGAVVTKPAADR